MLEEIDEPLRDSFKGTYLGKKVAKGWDPANYSSHVEISPGVFFRCFTGSTCQRILWVN